ncbi:hypothetical protein Thiowin_03410 [Thiorhodovibrio winogradskyi]|uniref:Uncharacterized protein n=1 Tax=Thiorhodovibrio winogradskyi TaxID=77007 RepID=A0ABZ0SCS0_9GAMM
MATLGGFFNPCNGLCLIQFHTLAARMELAEPLNGIGIRLRGGQVQPMRGALGLPKRQEQQAQFALGGGVPSIGGGDQGAIFVFQRQPRQGRYRGRCGYGGGPLIHPGFHSCPDDP